MKKAQVQETEERDEEALADALSDWRWRRDVAKVTEGLADTGTLGDQVVEMLRKSLSRVGSFAAAALTGAEDRQL